MNVTASSPTEAAGVRSERPRLLVLDAYHAEGRRALHKADLQPAGELYRRLLEQFSPDAQVDVCLAADADVNPPPGGLGAYQGACWTGSSLAAHKGENPSVRRMVELCRALFRAGVPQFGSCFAAHLAVTAAGGACARHPRGREFGVAQPIRLSPEGVRHPLFAGRAPVFQALVCHEDEVVRLPPGGRVLAGNDWCRVQALEVEHEAGRFFALQYHPEYDLAEVAKIGKAREAELIGQGRFASPDEAESWRSKMIALSADPSRRELAEELDVGEEVLDPLQRAGELRRWLKEISAAPRGPGPR